MIALLLPTAAMAVTLKKTDVDTYLSNQYQIGEINPSVPVWPLFSRDPVAATAASQSISWWRSIPTENFYSHD
ncbi:MAG: hypothetical protein NTZ96_06610 [Burkholderiales bacterium]|nr:hypothetical protein [Burkholderiales bacterium]